MRSVFQRETDLNSRWAGDELGTASEISDKNSGYRAGQAQALQALFTQVESIRSELALSEQKGTLSVGIMNLRLRDLLAYVAGSTMWTPEERSKHTIPEELMKLADAALYQGKRLEGIRENVAYEVTEFITPPRDIFEMKGIIPSTEVKNAVGVTQVRL
jgi:GGDEF domain-containing protein